MKPHVCAILRRIACLALHLGLLALPVLVGWQAPAKATDKATAWVNHGDIPRAVMKESRRPCSTARAEDGKYRLVFAAAGDFCSLQPHMTGRIMAKPSAS